MYEYGIRNTIIASNNHVTITIVIWSLGKQRKVKPKNFVLFSIERRKKHHVYAYICCRRVSLFFRGSLICLTYLSCTRLGLGAETFWISRPQTCSHCRCFALNAKGGIITDHNREMVIYKCRFSFGGIPYVNRLVTFIAIVIMIYRLT